MTSFISDSFSYLTHWVSDCFSSSDKTIENPDFQELTKRLKPEELQKINQKLQGITERNIADFVAVMCSSEWSTRPIFKELDFPYFALAAVRQGKISCHQFATIMNYWVKFANEGRTVRQFPLFFPNGTRNPLAENILRQHLMQRRGGTGQFSLNQFNEFYEKMKEVPASEQTLFVGDFNDQIDATEMNETLSQIGFDLFYRHNTFILLPSATLFETYLAVKYANSAVKLNPVLGLSSVENIRQNGLYATRDVAIHFPGVELPDEADRVQAPGYAFTFHDYYHAATASSIPDNYRKNLIKIAEVAQRLSRETGETFLASLAETIMDLEATNYRVRADGGTSLMASAIYKKNPDNFLFWNFLLANLDKSKYQMYSNPAPEDRMIIRKWVLEFPVAEGYREGVQDFLKEQMDYINDTLNSLDEIDPSIPTDQWRVKLQKEKQNHLLHVVNESWKERLAWDTGIIQES